MTTEDPKIVVQIYDKNGQPTGQTEKIDLGDPEEAEKFKESLQQQDGEFD